MATSSITSDGGKADLESTPKESVRDAKKKTNEDVEISNFEQYILSQNIDLAANYFMSNQDLFNYRTFRQINGPGMQIINKLRGIDNVDVFYKIKNSTLSLMRPKLRLYKVNYEEYGVSENGKIDQSKLVALKQPCYKEFKFSDNFGLGTALTVQDYLAYESTKPNWRNVGLESFSVKQDGKKHGVIENNIECKLELSFKSLKDVQAQPPGEPSPEKGGLRYVDLITWPAARIDKETETYNPKHYEIKAFLGYTAPSEEELNALSLSREDIEAIKNIEKLNLVISLSLYNYKIDIKDNGQVKLSGQYRGRIETTIGTNQVSIFQNTFRMSKNGDLTISRKVDEDHNISRVFKIRTMIGSIHRQLKSAGCKDYTCDARKNLKDLVEKDLFFSKMIKEAFGTPLSEKTGIIASSGGKLKVKGDGTAMFDFFKEEANINVLDAAIKSKVGMFKKDVYKSFMDQLIDGNTEKENAPGTRLFCINAGSKVVQDSLGVIVEDKSGAGVTETDETIKTNESEVKKSATTAIATGDAGVKIDRCHLVSPIDPAIKNQVAQDLAGSIETEAKSKDKETGEEHKDPARASVRDFSGKNYKFYFVYLGDIVELACKNAGLGKLDLESNPNIRNEGFSVFSEESYFRSDSQNSSLGYPLKNARMLLGPIEFYDSKGNIRTINLAQFPISFNYFRAWFMRKVVRRRRTHMPLGSFITLLINDLVMPALGAGMPKSVKVENTRQSLVSLTLPGKQVKHGGDERRFCDGQALSFEEALPMKQVIDVSSAEFNQEYFLSAKNPVSSESLVKTSFDYLLVYVSTHKNIIERRGDPAEDVKDGIYHFNIGSDMGLLKSMDFKRLPLKGLAELRSRQAEEQGIDSLQQLKFPYSTNLKLVGNSLFMPGMFYYVNPSLAGLGSVEDATSLAYAMNLGGYHLIMTVTTNLTSRGFETTIEGIQTSQGRR